MQAEQAARAAPGRAMRQAGRSRDSRLESMLAWAVVVAVHAALFWLASKLLMPPQRAAADDDDPVLVWLPPAMAPAGVPTPRVEAAPLSREAPPASAAPRSRPRSSPVVAPPAQAPASDTGLTAVEIAPVGEAAATLPASTPSASAPRAPWDAPPPVAKPFASRSPPLPGQGAQRFRMQPPRSIAATVERIGRMFGGGGPSDCAETRKNIRDLAVLGAEAVAQELEEERRNCGN
ncbi:conserved hypothetical protein [Lysobacter enzymogenes]|uniref:Uncharacterized protein n=2 Tax=Lysobacter enzymogenes TaxID=69 RepID=A0AAU9ASC1_LYSEN|nr:conserved hypothetical protein [Lysobacter enzymogenes]